MVTKPVDRSRAHSDRRAAKLALQPRLGYYPGGGAGLVAIVLLVLLLMADLTLKRSRGMWTARAATLAGADGRLRGDLPRGDQSGALSAFSGHPIGGPSDRNSRSLPATHRGASGLGSSSKSSED
jgi:hypothetical protein